MAGKVKDEILYDHNHDGIDRRGFLKLHKARARLQHLLRASVCDNERHRRESREPVLDAVSAV